MSDKVYDCKKCVNQGSFLCNSCTYFENAKGITKPSKFKPIQGGDFVPPLGLKPKHVHDQERAVEISNVLIRYLQIGLPIPIEWVDEYNNLRTKDNKNTAEKDTKS